MLTSPFSRLYLKTLKEFLFYRPFVPFAGSYFSFWLFSLRSIFFSAAVFVRIELNLERVTVFVSRSRQTKQTVWMGSEKELVGIFAVVFFLIWFLHEMTASLIR